MLILASTSEFRAKLLQDAAIPFRAVASNVEEVADPKLSPRDQALHFARQKAQALAPAFPDDLILGCDQTLEIDGELLRKPKDRDEAKAELKKLSGKTHFLHSALCLTRRDGTFHREEVITVALTMYDLRDAELEAYLDTEEWRGCAGAFRVESQGLQLFQSIQGDFHAIIGLPMTCLIAMLREAGQGPWFHPPTK